MFFLFGAVHTTGFGATPTNTLSTIDWSQIAELDAEALSAVVLRQHTTRRTPSSVVWHSVA